MITEAHRYPKIHQHVPKSSYVETLSRSIERLRKLSVEELKQGKGSIDLSRLSNFMDILIRRGRKALVVLRESNYTFHHERFLSELRDIIKADDV